MQKKLLYVLVLAMLILSACTGQTGEAVETPVPEKEASENTSASDQAVNLSPDAEVNCVATGLQELPEKPDLPAVTEEDWLFGNPAAPVTILEYSELQCPYCAQLEPLLLDLQQNNPDAVNLVFRHFPLSMHDKAGFAAQALEAAGKQNPEFFFELKNSLFEKQGEWSQLSVEDFHTLVYEEVEALGADLDQFKADYESDEIAEKIAVAVQDAITIGISGTPSVFINGFPYNGQRTVDALEDMVTAIQAAEAEYGEEVIAGLPKVGLVGPESLRNIITVYNLLLETYGEEYLANIPIDLAGSPEQIQLVVDFYVAIETLKDKVYDTCPEMVINPEKQYLAKFDTEFGEFTIELFADKAPYTVNSFVFLAREGWFDNTQFHRVIPGFVAQGGDPSATGIGSPGYEYGNEINDLKYDKAGVVGMANSGPDTNGSQFFISYGELPSLDGGYTIFGQVIEGMDVVEGLTPGDPNTGVVEKGVNIINSVTIVEN
jgi:cyclophilin family peptidyl-prolyl cis-trans isomerase/protein-disulfide isomerase